MRIANNLPALSAFNALNDTNRKMQNVITQLSTGLRINSASDDAAGFAISEKMRSQISGLDTALRNSQDGISLLQTAEGALGETNSMLQRMRELAVQASNDSLTSNDRQYIQLEIDELRDQINRIAGTTQFNKKRILDGSSGTLWASSDLNLKARINGGLSYIDQFGQKVNSEGNYRIDVSAEAGQCQVQKSNIMSIKEVETETTYKTETITETITEIVKELVQVPITEPIYEERTINYRIDLASGTDSLGATSGEGWRFENDSLIISGIGVYDVTGQVTDKNIVVESRAADIFLSDVVISCDHVDKAAFEVKSGATANIYLNGNVHLRGGGSNNEVNYFARAGLEVPDGASVSIYDAKGYQNFDSYNDYYNNASHLEALGHGAGIGGPGSIYRGDNGRAGYIAIWGGLIHAEGDGAGIGGGRSLYGNNGGGDIFILGGYVYAQGGAGSAGIGSGYYAAPTGENYPGPTTSDGTHIEILGGHVEAYGGPSRMNFYWTEEPAGAGIGGGGYSSAGTIVINSDIRSNVEAFAGQEGDVLPPFAEDIGDGGQALKNVDTQIIDDIARGTEWPYGIPERPTITTQIQTGEEIVGYVEEEVLREVEYEVTHEILREVEIEVEKSVKTLSEISNFYNPSGTFLLSQPQTLTITQGNGRTASITLYETDTMEDAAKKINDAIANSLGQGAYTDNPNKFCTLSDGTENTSESVYSRNPIYSDEIYKRDENGDFVLDENGHRITLSLEERLEGYEIYSTMLIRSVIPGKAGELTFSGDEDLLKALGLNTIQESSESTYTASIYDAHSGKAVTRAVKLTGNTLHGAINPNIDIEFDSMAGINASWDENTKRYILSDSGIYSAALHLKDNGITFQTGANKGEDFMIQLGDTSGFALGIDRVNLMTRESASRSITILDQAINKVSTQRARIGAYQNALEHTMENLTTTSLNLTAAESRIRDADMSKAMMELVRLQILNQSGTSMLAQANQTPQSVLSLLQG